jgi:hypothetical protein
MAAKGTFSNIRPRPFAPPKDIKSKGGRVARLIISPNRETGTKKCKPREALRFTATVSFLF